VAWPEILNEGGVGGPPEGFGDLGGEALDDFCNFSIKITHFYTYFSKILILKQ